MIVPAHTPDVASAIDREGSGQKVGEVIWRRALDKRSDAITGIGQVSREATGTPREKPGIRPGYPNLWV